MAQSRPTTTTDGSKALTRTISDLQRRVRDLELREDPPTGGGGGGSGAWAVIDHNRDWIDGTAGHYAQMADMTTLDDSGGFTQPSAEVLALPDGLYAVEWSFDFWFPFVNPYTGGYFGRGWALWRGGAAGITNSVRCFTSYDERMLIPVTLNDDGGGDASITPEAGNQVAWRGIVRAQAPNNLLSLAITDFYDLYPAALDWASDFNAIGQAASNGSGHQNVFIGSIGS